MLVLVLNILWITVSQTVVHVTLLVLQPLLIG
jgi:hypothetical protein